MSTPGPEAMHGLAVACVTLVAEQFGRHLDWSLDSLAELDSVCVDLRAEGPLAAERLDLWQKLAGAYTGEVAIRAYGGGWTTDEESGTPTISVLGVTGYPFSIARRVLSGEPFKGLASFGRVLPAISDHSRRSG